MALGCFVSFIVVLIFPSDSIRHRAHFDLLDRFGKLARFAEQEGLPKKEMDDKKLLQKIKLAVESRLLVDKVEKEVGAKCGLITTDKLDRCRLEHFLTGLEPDEESKGALPNFESLSAFAIWVRPIPSSKNIQKWVGIGWDKMGKSFIFFATWYP